MKLLFKSRGDTAEQITYFKTKFNYKMGTRDNIISSTLNGVERINSIEYAPTDINIIHNRPPGEVRGYMPETTAEFNQYKEELQRVSDNLTITPTIITVENEAYIAPNLNPDMVMVANMVKENLLCWHKKGITVSTSGLDMYISGGLTDKYLREVKKDQAAALKFRENWVYPYQYDLQERPLNELQLLKKATGLVFPIHLSIGNDNVDSVDQVLQAMKYWAKPHTLIVNELSFHEAYGYIPDGALVKKVMDKFKAFRIPVVVGYSGEAGTSAVVWTDDMKKAFIAYG